MEQYKYVQELLSTATGSQGTLLIERKIYDTLIDEVQKALIPREVACLYLGPDDIPGSSIDVNSMVADSMDVRIVAEGAEIPLDQASYTTVNLLPLKYGVGIRITRELLEDAKWNLLEHNIGVAGRRLADNENSLIVVALDAAANTITGGASITVANITRAMQYLEDSDYSPSDFVVGMEVLNDLRNLDTFTDYNKIGNTDMLSKGFLGNIYGMTVVKSSTNAGMTATSSYVTDRRYSYIIAEKRPITVENFDLPTHDLSAASVTQRIVVTALKTAATAKITTT